MTKEREQLMLAAYRRGEQDYCDGNPMLPTGSAELEDSLCYLAGYYSAYSRDVTKALKLKDKAND